MTRIKLGGEVKDTVTGFQGVAVARTEWLHGVSRISIQPPVDIDGRHPDCVAFDEPSVEKAVTKDTTGYLKK